MSEPPKDNNLGSSDFSTEKQPVPSINSEMAQYLAQKCARDADSIASSVLEEVYPKPHEHYFEDSISPELSLIVVYNEEEPDISLTVQTDRIQGTGDALWGKHFINFHYNRGALPQDLKETFGVDTPCMLGVSLHTDEITRQRVIEALERNEVSTEFMYTYYYFDIRGNFAKTIQIPVDWDDDRAQVSRDKWYKTLRADMTPQDFELVGGALELIKVELSKYLEQKNLSKDQDQS